MRKRISYRLCLLLCAAVLLFAQVPAEAAESAVPYIQQMIQYYRYYQEEAGDQIQVLLDYITYLDPEKGDLWETIMEHWSYYNSQMEPSYDVLPDGLPEDETLCIAVLGYALNSDGSMQPELVDRLEVADFTANCIRLAARIGDFKPITEQQVQDIIQAFHLPE